MTRFMTLCSVLAVQRVTKSVACIASQTARASANAEDESDDDLEVDWLSSMAHAKMKSVINHNVDPEKIWNEIEINKELYCEAVEFDGGFKVEALISENHSLDTWRTSFMPRTYEILTKIRNCLVHAREKRENMVILPTRRNDWLIRRYIPIIQRMAEEIAIRTPA